MSRARSIAILCCLAALAGTLAAGFAGTSAAADKPVAGGYYQGRGLDLYLTRSGRKIDQMYASARSQCHGSVNNTQPTTITVPNGVRVKNGKFSWREVQPLQGATAVTKGSGKFIDGGTKVVLAARETLDNRLRNIHCDTGRETFTGEAGEVQQHQVGYYKGQTSQGKSVSLFASNGGSGSIEQFRTTAKTKCDRGRGSTRFIDADFLKLEDGEFSDRQTSFLSGGNEQIFIKGKLEGTTVKGTVRATTTGREFPENGPAYKVTCDSGRVPFTAKH